MINVRTLVGYEMIIVNSMVHSSLAIHRLMSNLHSWNVRRLVSSVGRASVCCAGGRGFEPQTNTQGLKITEENVLPL